MKLNSKTIARFFFYALGMITLAFGIILNTKSNLGVSPIISVAYCASRITGINFGDATFVWYSIFVVFEVIVHISKKKYKLIIPDLLQIVVSLVFTRFMNLFSAMIPMTTDMSSDTFYGSMVGRLAIALIGITLTGIGAAMSLNARLIPNPGDGVVQTLADLINKSVGLTKNIWDIGCVSLTCILGITVLHRLEGVGIGTILAMILVGRVVAVYNYLLKAKVDKLSGIES